MIYLHLALKLRGKLVDCVSACIWSGRESKTF